MANKKKDEAIGTPQSNAGPRYPFATVLWQGTNHKMVFDDTPPNASDTSGGGKQYNTDPGGGVMHIAGKDGSHIELASVSGRFSVRSTGQYHQSAGKGMTSTVEDHSDSRTGGGERSQVKDERATTTGGGTFTAGGAQDISVNKDTKTEGTTKDKHSITKGDSVGSADGNSFSQSRGDQVQMHKGQSIRVTDGEDGHYVINGNGSSVYENSYKIYAGKKFKHEVKDKYDTKASSDLVIESETKITFKVGGSTIVMTPDGIHIKADTVKIGGGGTVMVKGSTVKIGGGATVQVVSGSNLVNPDWVSGGSRPDDPDAGQGANVGRD